MQKRGQVSKRSQHVKSENEQVDSKLKRDGSSNLLSYIVVIYVSVML